MLHQRQSGECSRLGSEKVPSEAGERFPVVGKSDGHVQRRCALTGQPMAAGDRPPSRGEASDSR